MESFIGSILPFAGNFAPQGWALCNGTLYPISQYQAVFSILGTQYGGDGTTTFAVPDLRGRTPLGTGQAPGLSAVTPGLQVGAETVMLTSQQLPAHNHMVICDGLNVSSNSPDSNLPGSLEVSNTDLYGNAGSGIMLPGMLSVAGGNSPVDVRQPSLAVNYIICMEGIYPSRN